MFLINLEIFYFQGVEEEKKEKKLGWKRRGRKEREEGKRGFGKVEKEMRREREEEKKEGKREQ